MPKFTVRIELHRAEQHPGIYDALHTSMKKHGFSRTIVYGETAYELPSAEYNRSGESLIGNKVLDDAKAAANQVWSDFSVLVTETTVDRLRYNLKKAK